MAKLLIAIFTSWKFILLIHYDKKKCFMKIFKVHILFFFWHNDIFLKQNRTRIHKFLYRTSHMWCHPIRGLFRLKRFDAVLLETWLNKILTFLFFFFYRTLLGLFLLQKRWMDIIMIMMIKIIMKIILLLNNVLKIVY